MPLIIDNSSEIPILKLQGDLDISTINSFKENLIKFILEGHTSIISDLSELEYLDCSGLGLFLSASFSLNNLGGSLTLRNPQIQVKDLFDSTQITKKLNIEEV
ncbi:MAG: STAS domain-containing protein [Candidatus Sericytochromatia bacterium]